MTRGTVATSRRYRPTRPSRPPIPNPFRTWRARHITAALAVCLSLPLLTACNGSDGDGSDTPSGAVPADHVRIHYHRDAGDYEGWGIHTWAGTRYGEMPWEDDSLAPDGTDDFGAYFDLPLAESANRVHFLFRRGVDGEWRKDPANGADKSVPGEDGGEYWFVQNDNTRHDTRPDPGTGDHGSLAQASAHWLNRDTVAWNVSGSSEGDYALHYSASASLAHSGDRITGADGHFELTHAGDSLPPALAERFPHLSDYDVFTVNGADATVVKAALRGQLGVVARNAAGETTKVSGVQIPGVLDDLYARAATDVALGVTYAGESPVFRVWAPTAQSVRLLRFESASDPDPDAVAMTRNPDTGVWAYAGSVGDDRMFYLYEVTVFAPAVQEIVTNRVTDPYSVALGLDSDRSFAVDLGDERLAPAGWNRLEKPALDAPEDIVLYELHVRDFSVSDETVAPQSRGKFSAFAETGTDGMKHLAALADAGLTHVHLLPTFDIATVPENAADRQAPDKTAMKAAVSSDPASEQPQAEIAAVADDDAFNWGYDPYHYNVPEGSYASDAADPTARIVEFRRMVQGLNEAGLRVVMDVVYNHTHASGQGDLSVLDRVVPGYYHRLDPETGEVETSTCCQNTATEHAMMRKLMVDSVVHWATAYRVDGFRFDLMGHHMKADMEAVRHALDELTQAKDGVDGSSVYVYGEGWNFGEVANDARGVNAIQRNMAGTGIGSFNDRLRDAVRGGSPFDDPAGTIANQGFINGLHYDPNSSADAGTGELLRLADRIRIGLTGNLKGYVLENRNGDRVAGGEIPYGDDAAPTGYTADPQEVITYVSAHDNLTLWDVNAFKMPLDATTAERVRAQNLGISLSLLGQGIPFFHAGVDLLRSKSMDRNSYDSGDWFNRLDWSYGGNNWARGLPPKADNGDKWSIIAPRLAGIEAPGGADIQRTRDHMLEMLQVRDSTPLLRLRTAAQIRNRVRFHNTGPEQIPGVIVMSIADGDGGVATRLDEQWQTVVVAINATTDPVTVADDRFRGATLDLHPVLAHGTDPVIQGAVFDGTNGRLDVPARTTAVFVGESALEANAAATAE